MKIGLGMYQAPALRMQLECTECGKPINASEGTTDEAIVMSRQAVLGDPPNTTHDRCSKCGQTKLKEAGDA